MCDIGQRPSGTTKEDTFLLAGQKRTQVMLFEFWHIRQASERAEDPVSSGFLLQSQLSRLFLRLEVPLQLPTVKILCQRFSGRGSPEMVNYEKLLWFLKVAASDDPQQNKRVEDSEEGNSNLNFIILKFQIFSYLQVRAICGKHGLYLTLSLLETLLNHQDLGYQDEIK
eukprot:bmy_22026T0